MEDDYIFIMRDEGKISLDKLLITTTPTLNRKIDIFTSIVNRVIAMKNLDVFHRDLKPGNIIIKPNADPSSVAIIDFGCSSDHSADTYSGFVGTRAYMAPELFVRDAYLAEPVTIWSLGVLLFFLLFNRLPFYTQHDTIHNPPTWRGEEDVPTWVLDLAKSMLDKVPTCRPNLMETYGHLVFNA